MSHAIIEARQAWASHVGYDLAECDAAIAAGKQPPPLPALTWRAWAESLDLCPITDTNALLCQPMCWRGFTT